jgi:SAM-dependent methyltransferase
MSNAAAPTSAPPPSAQDQFDDATSMRLERIYLTPDVCAQRAVFVDDLGATSGQSVLDLGCGMGLTTLALAEAVGAAGSVVGVDVAAPMLALASRRLAAFPCARVLSADVVQLPFEAATFDCALAVQVLEYVTDVDAALRELVRVLKNGDSGGGRAVIVDTDWASCVWASSDDARMERVIGAWNEHIPHPQLPRTLRQRMLAAGFRNVQVHARPIVNVPKSAQTPSAAEKQEQVSASCPDCYSIGMMDLIAPFAIGRNGLTAADLDAWRADLLERNASGDYFFSLNRFAFVGLV